MRSHTSATPRYTTWFGTLTSGHHSIVVSHFNKMNGNSISTFTYDCTTCVKNDYGYVYPNDFGTIYLCSEFWDAPLIGTDSKAGTLVRLTSQFTTNGGTVDLEYGSNNCKSLAKSNPGKAITNTDNYQYFAVNNPPLS